MHTAGLCRGCIEIENEAVDARGTRNIKVDPLNPNAVRTRNSQGIELDGSPSLLLRKLKGIGVLSNHVVGTPIFQPLNGPVAHRSDTVGYGPALRRVFLWRQVNGNIGRQRISQLDLVVVHINDRVSFPILQTSDGTARITHPVDDLVTIFKAMTDIGFPVSIRI